jgi:tetraacyldisaccharide 4'-kinase
MRRGAGAISAALAIPAAAYAAVIRLRNAWYDRPGAIRRVEVPVISVGNLAVGGTGKTPLVAWIARRLQAEGLVPAVVSRGYGGTAGPGPLVVSTGGGPRVNARTCGDEPHLLARSLKGVIVVVGADRIEGARCAAAAGAGVVVLDDGFQHRRLARDLDIVVLDGRAPFADGHLLPRGPLREPPVALGRAQMVVLTRVREADPAQDAVDSVRAAGYSGPIVRAGHRTTGFQDVSGGECPPPGRALAFCGIGDPLLFRGDLEAAGVVADRFRAFRDHHPYTLADWEALLAEGRAAGVPLITTEKDLSRLEAAVGASLTGSPLVVLRIETVVWDEARLLDAVRGAVAAHAGSAPR